MVDRLVYLQVTTWAEISVGRHYYGTLVYKGGDERTEHDMQHVMSRSEVKDRNKQEKYDGYRSAWKLGDESTAFWSIKDLHAAATKEYRERFPKARMLVEGSSSDLSPIYAIAGTNKQKVAQANKLYESWEELYEDGEDDNPDLWKPLQADWDKLMDSL